MLQSEETVFFKTLFEIIFLKTIQPVFLKTNTTCHGVFAEVSDAEARLSPRAIAYACFIFFFQHRPSSERSCIFLCASRSLSGREKRRRRNREREKERDEYLGPRCRLYCYEKAHRAREPFVIIQPTLRDPGETRCLDQGHFFFFSFQARDTEARRTASHAIKLVAIRQARPPAPPLYDEHRRPSAPRPPTPPYHRPLGERSGGRCSRQRRHRLAIDL